MRSILTFASARSTALVEKLRNSSTSVTSATVDRIPTGFDRLSCQDFKKIGSIIIFEIASILFRWRSPSRSIFGDLNLSREDFSKCCKGLTNSNNYCKLAQMVGFIFILKLEEII
ncbi:hypothetical protein CKA32_004953 [Geitlerinema sp. FC II]|nr:hypothetical protein CKA32_004953 [Geitlerinema sp. FC II]